MTGSSLSVLIAALVGLSACASPSEEAPSRLIHYENGSVCVEPPTRGHYRDWPASKGDAALPPISLLRRSGFLVCRAHQAGLIDDADYAGAILDTGPTILRADAARARRVLGLETVGATALSPHLRAACAGLAPSGLELPNATLFCQRHAQSNSE